MKTATYTVAILTSTLIGGSVLAGGGEWVDLANETNARSNVSSSLFATDTEEKDYAWGDVDNDGDTDLVIARKQEFTSTGKRANVLLMNEGGVLVDRTAEFASASDVNGDNGFLTPTNDRDVILEDVDGDGWLDIVTATTLSDNDPKHISHPRVYINLGEDAGVWQGFEHQDARIPQMHATAGPRFCSVAAGDLTQDGDGRHDLYFGDYDSGGGQIFDYNNKVLINDGNGFFSDGTNTILPDFDMRESAFGAATEIADMNGDGRIDVVKQTSLNPPQHIAITYHDGPGSAMDDYDVVYSLAPYFVETGDLNNDGMLDMVIVDDNNDRFMINTGNGGDGAANFSQHNLLLQSGGTESAFGGNAFIIDLDDDGWQDAIVTDVDVDIPNCTSDRMHIYRNQGTSNGQPGGVPTMQEQGAIIPTNMQVGVHDVAVFDINGDNLLDMVVGRCSSTEIWMQQSDDSLSFSYPSGRPSTLVPNEITTFQVQVAGVGKGVPQSDTGELFVSIDGGPFNATSMNHLGGNLYEADLPGVDCASTVNYYVEAEMQGGVIFSDPGNAPATTYLAIASLGVETFYSNEFEADVADWTVQNDASLTSGAWEAVDPNGTVNGTDFSAPEDDNTDAGTDCFVTENGAPGGSAGAADVDGGPTHLLSPTIDLDGTDATVSYAQWFFTTGDDSLDVYVSNNNGASWVLVDTVTSTNDGDNTAWDGSGFKVSDHVTPTAQVRVRFTTGDSPNNNITEAGIDDFVVERLVCDIDEPCVGDFDGSGSVGAADLLALLAAWGTDGDGADLAAPLDEVGVPDLLVFLALWGDCP